MVDESFSKDNIETLLKELAKEFNKRIKNAVKDDNDFEIDIYIVGGASIMLQLSSRDSTRDVDAYFNDVADLTESIYAIAQRYDLSPKWMNKGFKFTSSYTEDIMAYCKLYRKYGRIKFFLTKLDVILCMKLVACRTFESSHDIEDILAIKNHFITNNQNVNKDTIYSWLEKHYPQGYVLTDTAKAIIDNW